MEQLQRILRRLKDVNFVTRPRGEEDAQLEQMSQEDEQAMGSPLPGEEPVPQDVNIRPQAIDTMLADMQAQQQGDMTPASEPEQAQDSPLRKKMKYLDTMHQMRKNKFPEQQANPTALGGGSGGLRI